MSQLRVMLEWVRRAIVAACICALWTGGVISSAAAHSPETPNATLLTQAPHSVACEHHAGLFSEISGLNKSNRSPENKHSERRHCPDCCFFADSSDIVLPERPFAAIRFLNDPATTPNDAFRKRDKTDGLSSRLAHGARAPPTLS